VYLPSGNRGAILITSRNPQCERLAKTDAHEELDRLEENECVELFQKAARDIKDPENVIYLVKHLGYHALAVLHAASYVANTHRSVADYLYLFRTHRQRLLQRPHSQAQSRYDTVYAALGASIEFLEQPETGTSEETRKDSPQLLEVLSTFHYESVPLDIFVDAGEPVKSALKIRKKWEMYSDAMTAWHVAQLPDFVRTEKDELRFRLNEAVTRLEALALVRIDASARSGASVSMHPLVHGWARDRQSQRKKKQTLRMTECIVAFSSWGSDWRPYHRHFAPHLKLVVESDVELVDDAIRHRGVLQLCVNIAWIYHLTGLDRAMYEFIGTIFKRLGLRNTKPTLTLRGLYHSFAAASSLVGSSPAEVLEVRKAIARLDKKTRVENDPARLENLCALGVAYLKTGQSKQAVALLRKAVKARQDLGEEHKDLLRAQRILALALSENGQYEEAIPLIEKVVGIRERLLPADHVSRQTSQSVLAIAYLHNGQVAEATPLLEELARLEAQTIAEMDPDRPDMDAHDWLAEAFKQAGRLSEAVALRERVVNTQALYLDKTHPNLLYQQCCLASAYLDTGRLQDAIGLMDRLRQISDSGLDETAKMDHRQDVIWAQGKLARVHLKAGRALEAISTLEQAVDFGKSKVKAKCEILLYAQYDLGRAYLHVGRISEAVTILEHVVEMEKHPEGGASKRLLDMAYSLRESSFSHSTTSPATQGSRPDPAGKHAKAPTPTDANDGPGFKNDGKGGERSGERPKGVSSNKPVLSEKSGRTKASRTRRSNKLSEASTTETRKSKGGRAGRKG
jgi:tetratricopeptide (TPR) repeat protein